MDVSGREARWLDLFNDMVISRSVLLAPMFFFQGEKNDSGAEKRFLPGY